MSDMPMDGAGNYIYEVSEISNYDGDSFRLDLVKRWDFGFKIHVEQQYHLPVRIVGIDTPELRDKRAAWKAAAYLARDEARAWVKSKAPCKFISMDKPDKYGRGLGDIEAPDGTRLTEYLLEKHLAVPYIGQNKLDVEAAHQENIFFLLETGAIKP